MHRRLILAAACMCAISAQLTFAQTPAPAPQAGGPRPIPNAVPATPQPPPPPPAPSASGQSIQGQPVNIKVEFTIADQRGTAPPVKRVVSVIASDRNLGRIRSSAIVTGQPASISLNVDATPTLLKDGKIQLQFTLLYDWPAPDEPAPSGRPVGTVTRSTLSDSVTLVLADGKPMIAAQSADPVGDRTVSVEVKATILR